MATFVSGVDTFVVEEIPAYRPSGAGTHTYLWIEKQGLTTNEAIKRVARALRVKDRDVGYAGLKDRHATTRQFLSVPDVAPEAARALVADGLRVLEVGQHGNKLRMGHLRGNRFEVVVQGLEAGEEEALATRLTALARDGVPNRFGAQRFGASGDNVATALALLRGERTTRDRRHEQLMLSALQSAVFNETLALRAASGGLLQVRAGDVMQKRASGGIFVCEDVTTDAARVAAGEIVPTGPLPGNKEIEPPVGSPARALEDEALARVGVTRELIASAGRGLPGARRPVVIALELGEPALTREGPPNESTRARLRFSLPAGSYATVVLEALEVTIPPRAAAVQDSPDQPDPTVP